MSNHREFSKRNAVLKQRNGYDHAGTSCTGDLERVIEPRTRSASTLRNEAISEADCLVDLNA